MVMDLLSLAIVLCVATRWVSGSLYEVFSPCCHEGVQWSSVAYRCDNYPAPVANISASDQASCLAIIEVCCIKQTQMTICEEGKQTALSGDVCAIRDTDPGAEQFRECCHCCRLGLESRRSQPSCQTPGLGDPCDAKYRECCLGDENTGTFNVTVTTPPVSVSNHTYPYTTPPRRGSTPMSTVRERVSKIVTIAPPSTTSEDPTTPTTTAPTSTRVIPDTGLCRDGHRCQQQCVDRVTGFKECRCYPGYRLQTDGLSCQDIDECAERLSRCAPRQRCINTPGRYTCTSRQCPIGYTFNPNTRGCDPPGRQCETGFSYNQQTRNCEDVNECGLGTDSCLSGERCENSIGSYTCRRIRHCGTGYTLDDNSQTCVDNDECQLGTHNCGGGYRCQNIVGSFRCVPKDCESGYKFDHIKGECVIINCPRGLVSNSMGNCVDVNECEKSGKPACNRFQRCVNTRGSFYCRNIINCPPGYEVSDKDRCEDIDECMKGTHKCGSEQQCINRQGTYFCQCPRGLRHDNLGRCIDVDECSYGASICPPDSKCVNTVGSFSCECVDGLQVGDGDSCTDIDECSQQGICQQSCVNVLGTFFCTCDKGYQLRDDKRSCEDIDECKQFGGRGGKSTVCGGECINLPGSYTCGCPEGWRLKPDGKSCEDIDECKEGTAYCPGTDTTCINTRGGYKCPAVVCPEGFLKTRSTGQQNSVRCKRISTTCPECRRGLISRSFNFLSFASNVLIPAPLFSMTGSRLVNKFYTWDLNLLSARPLRADVKAATMDHFSLERSRDFARVTLIKRVEGPQDVVLELTMNVTSYYKGYEGKAQSHIHLYITDEDPH